MPTEIRVSNFPDQTGNTQAVAVANLLAIDPDVMIVIAPQLSAIPIGNVISQLVEAVEIEVAGGPVGSHGTRITLSISQVVSSLLASRWTGVPDPITGLTPAQAAAPSTSVVMSVFVDLDIVGDRLRLCDAGCTLNWGGFDWLGIGRFGGVDAVVESLEVLAQPVKLTLSGVESQYIADAMTTQYHGRAVAIYVGLLNPDTYAFIDTPEEVWSGFMDVMTIEVDQGMATITVDCEHRLRVQPATSRYTDEDQRARYPADVFFNALHLIPGYVGKWGARDVAHSGGGGGSGENRGPRRRNQPV